MTKADLSPLAADLLNRCVIFGPARSFDIRPVLLSCIGLDPTSLSPHAPDVSSEASEAFAELLAAGMVSQAGAHLVRLTGRGWASGSSPTPDQFDAVVRAVLIWHLLDSVDPAVSQRQLRDREHALLPQLHYLLALAREHQRVEAAIELAITLGEALRRHAMDDARGLLDETLAWSECQPSPPRQSLVRLLATAGETALAGNNVGRAALFFERAWRLAPADPEVLRGLVLSLLYDPKPVPAETERLLPALRYLVAAALHDVALASTCCLAGLLFVRLGEPSLANEALGAAKRSYHAFEREAEAELVDVIAVVCQNPDNHAGRVLALEQALTICRRHELLDARLVTVLTLLSQAALDGGDDERARALLEQAERLSTLWAATPGVLQSLHEARVRLSIREDFDHKRPLY